MKEEWKVYIKGVPGRGDEVIKALTDLGAENNNDYRDKDIGCYYIYFINHKGHISSASVNSEPAKIIMDNYHEIKLPEQWRDGDVLFSEADNEFAVFEEEYKIDSDKFLSYLATCFKGYLTCQVIRRGCFRLATKSEVAQFHERLHAINKDWDADKKQLTDWRWKPKIEETYWIVTGNNDIIQSVWAGTHVDNKYFDFGNCFRTREEAEAMAEKVKKLLKGE